MKPPIELNDAVVVLTGLKLEFARKSEEIWSRGLAHGYESATNEHDKVVYALDMALTALRPHESPLQVCPDCEGDGYIGNGKVKCDTCDGTGKVRKTTTRKDE